MKPDSDREIDRTAEAAINGETAVDQGSEIEALRKEIAELKDRNLRLMADMRNLQQRTQRDKEESLRFAEQDFARELLPVVDALEKAIQTAEQTPGSEAIVQGIRIVHEQFLKTLRAHRIEPIDALGKPFDPAVHEALLQQPHAQHPAGTVMEEFARGYRMHDRVIRPARVVVSAGPAQS